MALFPIAAALVAAAALPANAATLSAADCANLKKTHNIDPFVSNGTAPASVIADWRANDCDFRVGPFDDRQCYATQERFGLIPYRSWGNTPSYAQPLWNAAGCNQKMCKHWMAKYNVHPGVTWGSMPVELIESWNNVNMQCDLVVAVYNRDKCAAVTKKYGILPPDNWGKAPTRVKNNYVESSCPHQMCAYWKDEYKVTPFVDYGKMPAEIRASWNNSEMNCDFRIPTYNKQQCTNAADKYGYIPTRTWGTTPPYIQPYVSSGFCNQQLCHHWMAKYNVTPGVSWGKLPEPLKTSWLHPSMNCDRVVAVYNTSQCGAISEKYGVIPPNTWGNVTADIKANWIVSSCENELCFHWKAKYNVTPFVSYDKLPSQYAPAWNYSIMDCDLRVGPFNEQQCIQTHERFGLIPYRTWARTPSYVMPNWDAAGCNQKMCRYWMIKYNVKPGESWGSLNQTLQDSWNDAHMNCDKVVAVYNANQCAAITKQYNIIPPSNWGNATADIKANYIGSNCGHQMCAVWKAQYNVTPFESFGTMPKELQAAWVDPSINCNYRITPYSQQQCINAHETYGYIPWRTWGNTPVAFQLATGSGYCNQQLCGYWATKYNVTPFTDYGSMPTQIRASWNHTYMMCDFQVSPYTVKQCIQAHNYYGIFPRITWGTAPYTVQHYWSISECEEVMCGHWEDLYKVSSQEKVNNMPAQVLASYMHKDSNCKFYRGGKYARDECRVITSALNLTAPYSTKDMPENVRATWNHLKCSSKLSHHHDHDSIKDGQKNGNNDKHAVTSTKAAATSTKASSSAKAAATSTKAASSAKAAATSTNATSSTKASSSAKAAATSTKAASSAKAAATPSKATSTAKPAASNVKAASTVKPLTVKATTKPAPTVKPSTVPAKNASRFDYYYYFKLFRSVKITFVREERED